MSDMEKLALQRDRGYLVRLVLVLVVGALLGGWLFIALTSHQVGGCMANAFLGTPQSPDVQGLGQ